MGCLWTAVLSPSLPSGLKDDPELWDRLDSFHRTFNHMHHLGLFHFLKEYNACLTMEVP